MREKIVIDSSAVELEKSSCDEVVSLAAHACEAPIAILIVTEGGESIVKSARGLDAEKLALSDLPCATTASRGELLVVPDMASDERYRCIASGGQLSFRFFAGAPVLSRSAEFLGSLCVLDHEPRSFPDKHANALKALANLAAVVLEGIDTGKQLSRSEELFRLAIHGASAGLADWDLVTGDVFYSEKWKSLLGYRDDEIEGNIYGWRKLIHPEDLGLVLKATQDFFTKSSDVYEIEHRLRKSSGEYIWVLLTGACVRDSSGFPVRLVCWYEDITTRRDLESVTHRQRLQLARSEKLASLGAMAGGIAHEINNPMAIISGNAQRIRSLAAKGLLDLKALLSIAEKIERTVHRIVKIVRGLRNFAKDGDKDPFETVSVKSLVEETLEFCQMRFKGSATQLILPSISPDLTIECRAVPISQVLLNLLGNAFDAIQSLPEKWIRMDIEADSEWISISIVDSGSGIPPEVREKLMQPFFTTKESGKGTGLGLNLSKSIVESHWGHLYLDQASTNTRFTVRLPRKQVRQDKGFQNGRESDGQANYNFGRRR